MFSCITITGILPTIPQPTIFRLWNLYLYAACITGGKAETFVSENSGAEGQLAVGRGTPCWPGEKGGARLFSLHLCPGTCV